MTTTNRQIRTVIIPSAGRGTRLMPATKVTAKELLPVYDRPLIQFAVEEAADLGVERVVVVISDTKEAIQHYLGSGRSAAKGPEIVYVQQDEALGLGHAILCCKGAVLPGPFGVILPDDLILGAPCLSEMADNYLSGHMVAAMKVPFNETSQYGIFEPRGAVTEACVAVMGMVEKPAPGQAPSSLAAVGRYILTPMIFDILEQTPLGAGGEIQLTDALATALGHAPLTAFQFTGTRYDCGNHDGLLSAANARQAALRAERIGAALAAQRTPDHGNRLGFRDPAAGSMAAERQAI